MQKVSDCQYALYSAPLVNGQTNEKIKVDVGGPNKSVEALRGRLYTAFSKGGIVAIQQESLLIRQQRSDVAIEIKVFTPR